VYFNKLKRLTILAVLLIYLVTPMLDSMLCADCIGNVPFRGVTTISHIETSHVDVSYSKKGCSNSILDTEIYSPQVHILVAKSDCITIEQPLSELHCSIHKPPQNFLA
jgi:hypothetical protein